MERSGRVVCVCELSDKFDSKRDWWSQVENVEFRKQPVGTDVANVNASARTSQTVG